jgi:hypothetical protein
MSTITVALSSSKKLLAFYNANTAGAQVNKFADRKTAERRCALLAEELQAEKFTDAQIAAAILAGNLLAHAPDEDEEESSAAQPGFAPAVVVDHTASNARIAEMLAAAPVATQYPANSLRAKLAAEVAKQQPIAPMPKKADTKTPSAPRVVITKVRATLAGVSRCQEGSNRAAVLKAVQDAPDRTITVAELDAKFGYATRGYLQKLLEKLHIELVA